jgi:hypothetical protein
MNTTFLKTLKPKFIPAILSGLTLFMSLEAWASQTTTPCAFEGTLCPRVQGFFEQPLVHMEVSDDFDVIVQKPEQRGAILRNKFDASYGAADCQTQALLMMSILHEYPGHSFDILPPGVQTTLKAMHVLTKYFLNKRDAFGLVIDEEKSIDRIIYLARNGAAGCMLVETGITQDEMINTLGAGLAQTAIYNLQSNARHDLLEEFNHPKLHPTLGLPQSLTTMGLAVVLDFMKANRIPLLLKVTRIIGTKTEGSGKKRKGVFQGQGQQVMMLKYDDENQLNAVAQPEWKAYEDFPAFAIRLFAVKCTFKQEQFHGYAQQLHSANSFDDYIKVLGETDFVPFLLSLNAIVDDKKNGRLPVCAALQQYFNPDTITYQPTWTSWGCTDGSIPMESPHVYVTTLNQQLASLINVDGIVVRKRLFKHNGEK